MRPVPPARPVHAGRLALWERLLFAIVLAVLAAIVVAVTVTMMHGRRQAPAAAAAAGRGTAATQPVPAVGGRQESRGAARTARVALNRRLAAALAPVVRGQSGQLAVGVIDETTGAEAIYGGKRRFHTASIAKADVLAALLLQRQHSGVPLSEGDRELATKMIEDSDDDAATSLWNLAGAASGMAAANRTLGLRHTTAGPADYWGLTSTTVPDQLRLLRDLTTARSPLTARSRSYELHLMRDVVAGQRWGVSAAASAGSGTELKNGWLPDGPAQLWVINSIGTVDHDGQRLLLAVLSKDQPTEAAGIAQDEAAAIAAASCLTSGA
jgi:hypothetical protein